MVRKEFNKLLLSAVDDALSTLGDSAKRAIYYHLETKFEIAKSQIPTRIEAFDSGLEKIFGPGSKFLEILIMKRLYEHIGKPLQWDEEKELAFVEYVAAARQAFTKNA